MECGLGFTEGELALIRAAIEGGVIGVVILGLAFVAKVISQWLNWRE